MIRHKLCHITLIIGLNNFWLFLDLTPRLAGSDIGQIYVLWFTSVCCQGFFSWILNSKIGVKINFRIITKNHTADPEKRFLTKSILKAYGRATAMPPAWELRIKIDHTEVISVTSWKVKRISKYNNFEKTKFQKNCNYFVADAVNARVFWISTV